MSFNINYICIHYMPQIALAAKDSPYCHNL